jgi:hypothetical protein
MDLLFEVLNEWIKLGDIGRIVSLLVLSEAKQIRNVLWSPAMKVQFVLLQQQSTHRFVLRIHFGGESSPLLKLAVFGGQERTLTEFLRRIAL